MPVKGGLIGDLRHATPIRHLSKYSIINNLVTELYFQLTLN